jgi:hypothetical protein
MFIYLHLEWSFLHQIFRQIAFIFLWFKDIFLFSDVKFVIYLTKIKSKESTFVVKSPENINHADKNYYQINK